MTAPVGTWGGGRFITDTFLHSIFKVGAWEIVL